jgi:hypothetical protein
MSDRDAKILAGLRAAAKEFHYFSNDYGAIRLHAAAILLQRLLDEADVKCDCPRCVTCGQPRIK